MTLGNKKNDWGDPVTRRGGLGQHRHSREEIEEIIEELTENDLEKMKEKARRESGKKQASDVLKRSR